MLIIFRIFHRTKKKSKSKSSAHHVSEKGLKFVGYRQSFIIIGVEIAHGLGERIKIKKKPKKLEGTLTLSVELV